MKTKLNKAEQAVVENALNRIFNIMNRFPDDMIGGTDNVASALSCAVAGLEMALQEQED